MEMIKKKKKSLSSTDTICFTEGFCNIKIGPTSRAKIISP